MFHVPDQLRRQSSDSRGQLRTLCPPTPTRLPGSLMSFSLPTASSSHAPHVDIFARPIVPQEGPCFGHGFVRRGLTHSYTRHLLGHARSSSALGLTSPKGIAVKQVLMRLCLLASRTRFNASSHSCRLGPIDVHPDL